MELLLAAFLAFGLGMLGMATGVLFGRRPIRGSCDGLAALCDGSGPLCDFCPNRPGAGAGQGPGRTDS